MNKKLLYLKAYRLLNNSTPLKLDCGTLCNAACCEGDEDTGMYLFPGEEVMYESKPDFLTIKPTDLTTHDNENVLLAVCRGKCDRSLRPLSCRIFPLTPYIGTDNASANAAVNAISVIIDPRAKHLCPIAQYCDPKKLNQFFVRDVRSVFHLLGQDVEIRNFIAQLSRILDEFTHLL